MRYLTKGLSALFLAALISGCAGKDSLLDRAKTDTSLPKPSNVRTMSDRTSIGFEWDYPDSPTIAGYHIYRGSPSGGSELVGVIKDRFMSHYVDTNLQEDTSYSYRFSSYTIDKTESDATPVVSVKTAPQLEAVSFIASVNNLPNRSKIVWRPHVSPEVSGYIVQKSAAGGKNWEDVAKVSSRLMSEYIDKVVDNGKVYYYRVIAKTYDGSYSKPSQAVAVNTKNPPAVIPELGASKNLPKRIALSWQPIVQKEFSAYRLYKADAIDSPYSLIYTGKETKYLDMVSRDGETKYYKITVVDKDELESPLSQSFSVMGAAKKSPNTPIFTLATIKDNRVYLAWNKPNGESVAYKITKKWGPIIDRQSITYTDIQGLNFEDKEIDLGVKYLYSIEAVDKDGLTSKASDDVELFVPKGL
ncbi:MAG TPA: hypothetical protein PLV58_01870 [Campylobacterales bacterium]|nr:hypothetical protein [Campylobacterales bacterium]